MTLTNDERDKLVQHRLAKARSVQTEGRLLFDHNMLSASVNRIYYSMYHALSSLAIHAGFSTGKHGQLIGWFNKEYVKNGKVDSSFSKMITKAFEKRMDSDYDDFSVFSNEEVQLMLLENEMFIQMIDELLQ